VCVSVCVSSPRRILHGPACKCHLVVHYWADLQSVYGFRCYDNIARTQNASECLYSLYAWFRHWQISRHHAYNKRSNSHSSQCCPAVSLSLGLLYQVPMTYPACKTTFVNHTSDVTKDQAYKTPNVNAEDNTLLTLYW